jgi:hypothetical protein
MGAEPFKLHTVDTINPTKFTPFLRAFRKPVARGDYQRHRVHLSVRPRVSQSLPPGVGGEVREISHFGTCTKICRQASIFG